MQEPIYFSKIEFNHIIGHRTRVIILIDLVQKEMSYQVFEWREQAPAIEGTKSVECDAVYVSIRDYYAGKVIRNEKTNFKPILMKDGNYIEKEVYSYTMQFTNEQMKELLPYCNALDFEPFREKEQEMFGEGYLGYRDEVTVSFRAITNSHIPLICLPMDYYYDKQHEWPSEKLYRYVMETYFNKEQLNGYGLPYGACSLFF